MSGRIEELFIQKLDLRDDNSMKSENIDYVILRPKVKGLVVIEEDPRKKRRTRKDNGFAKSQPTTVKGGYPLKLLIPEHAASVTGCPWIYPMTFGGGIVAGDFVELQVVLQPNCSALLTSQESLKVYHCPEDQISEHVLHSTVNKGALLCVLQDPVVCFRNANYKQTQRIQLSCHGNIVFLDWFLAGRVARGEFWEFSRFVNNLEVLVDDELVLRERMDLRDTVNRNLQLAMKNYKVMATFLVLGEKLKKLSNDLFTKFGLPKEFGTKYDLSCTVSVSKLKYNVNDVDIGGVYIKVMADTTASAFQHLHEMIKPLFEIIGGDPFETKY